jgi:CDP-glucose 4,6-dehydratase
MSAFWQDRPVPITGATGLLGSHMARMLLERGASVTCLVRDWIPGSLLVRSGDIDRVQVARGALEDFPTLLRVINEHEIDTVFHLGAQTIVGTASRSVLSTFEANVQGTWNLLEACRQCPTLVKRVLVASSDKAYGAHDRLPYTEDLSLDGRFPYDASKACAELVCRSFWHSYRVPLAVTRCGNLFGAGDLNWNRLIPGTIRWALNGETPIIRSDGKFVRDYFYVEDAAAAYLLLAERLEERGLHGEAFNFGTEEPLDVVQVVERILERAGRPDLTPRIMNEASLEIREQYLNCEKARAKLDWHPAFTFDEGLDRTIEWYRGELSGGPAS